MLRQFVLGDFLGVQIWSPPPDQLPEWPTLVRLKRVSHPLLFREPIGAAITGKVGYRQPFLSAIAPHPFSEFPVFPNPRGLHFFLIMDTLLQKET